MSGRQLGDTDEFERIRSELDEVARSNEKLRIDLSRLEALSTHSGAASVDELLSFVVRCSERLPKDDASAVAAILADTEERWTHKFGKRQEDAARVLGKTRRQFRGRDGNNERSLYDLLFLGLAKAIVDETTSMASMSPREQEIKPGLRLRFGVISVVLLTVVGVAFAARFQMDIEGAEVGPLSPDELALLAGLRLDQCDVPLGASLSTESSDVVAIPFHEALLEAGGVERIGCPAGRTDEWQGLLHQELAMRDSAQRSFLVLPMGAKEAMLVEYVLFKEFQWALDGEVQRISGPPVAGDPIQGYPAIQLASGGLVIGQKADGPAFWVPAAAATIWLESGGPTGPLGLPMTDVEWDDGLLRQDFENGYLLQAEQSARPTIIEDAAVEEYFEKRGEPADQILRSVDGTAWWLDSDGTRHWIADGEIWACLGGESALYDTSVPGWVIGAHELGRNATCDDR